MFHGRILVVSERAEIAAELDPLIRAEGHLSLSVPNGEEALQVFEEGIIPDVVVSDAATPPHPGGERYLHRFRQLNHFGQLIRVVEGGSSAPTAAASPEPFLVLARPFDPEQVRQSLQGAIDQIRLDLQVLRGEMFRETGRLQQAIRDAQLEMVTALAVTMEAKDPYMHGHCARVAALAAQVAEEMEIGVDETERLQTAAVLHEIGKLGVSLELLHKVEPLTEGELEQLRSHPGVGAQIVGAIPSLRRLAPLIRNQYTDWADLPGHIERACPDSALAGILRVVDTFDAITSDRSYRPAAPREIWTAMLRRGAGSQFYPDAVRALFRVVERRDVR